KVKLKGQEIPVSASQFTYCAGRLGLRVIIRSTQDQEPHLNEAAKTIGQTVFYAIWYKQQALFFSISKAKRYNIFHHPDSTTSENHCRNAVARTLGRSLTSPTMR